MVTLISSVLKQKSPLSNKDWTFLKSNWNQIKDLSAFVQCF